MRCRFCRQAMIYVHGHAACADNRCPLYGQNQAECCDGETAAQSPASTSDIAAWSRPTPNGQGQTGS